MRRWGWREEGGAHRKHPACTCDSGHQAQWPDPRDQPVALQMQCATLGTADLSGGHLLRKGKVLQVKKVVRMKLWEDVHDSKIKREVGSFFEENSIDV